jgi:tight adherence protein C
MRPQDFVITDYLPTGVSPETAITVLAGLATLVTVLAMWQVLRPSNAFERRLEDVMQRKETLRQGALAAARRGRQRMTAVGVMRETVSRLNLLRSKHATEARNALAQAGIRSRDAMVAYLFARVTLPFLLGLLLLADAKVFHILPIPPQYGLVASLAGVMIGFYAPTVYLRNAAAKRGKNIKLALPDGLDLMVICAEAGLSLDATLVRVSRELGNGAPELGEEFAMTAAELTFMPDRRVAFDNLNARTNSDGIRAVVNTLQQTAKFGTPLAQSLRVLAAEMRTARITRAEEKAARLPALLTVPMILFILPTLFIVLLGPAALGIIDTFSHR